MDLADSLALSRESAQYSDSLGPALIRFALIHYHDATMKDLLNDKLSLGDAGFHGEACLTRFFDSERPNNRHDIPSAVGLFRPPQIARHRLPL
jgi:hypothetical protein